MTAEQQQQRVEFLTQQIADDQQELTELGVHLPGESEQMGMLRSNLSTLSLERQQIQRLLGMTQGTDLVDFVRNYVKAHPVANLHFTAPKK